MVTICSVCQKPATRLIADIEETEPVEVNGKRWAQFRTTGTDARCDEHKRRPVEVRLGPRGDEAWIRATAAGIHGFPADAQPEIRIKGTA